MSTWSPEEDAAFREAIDGENVTPLHAAENGDADQVPVTQTDPAAMLADSQVDLIAMIRDGIPEPDYVPGCSPWLRAGKRYLSPAPAGVGKSLAWAIVAVTVIEHGGRAVILDVENGADEYARRLEDILNARDGDGSLASACQQRLSYHAWPQFKLTWTAENGRPRSAASTSSSSTAAA